MNTSDTSTDSYTVTSHAPGPCPSCNPPHAHCPGCGQHLAPAYPYQPHYYPYTWTSPNITIGTPTVIS